MKRLALVLGIISLFATSSSAALLSEDFEGYAAGASVAGANGWNEVGRGEWFLANATVPSDPAFLQTRYADLSNNGQGLAATHSWLYRNFAKQSTGLVTTAFDVLFEVGGSAGLDSCNIYLSDGDKAPSEYNYTQIAAAINVGVDGLRIFDNGGWRVVENISITNGTWYRFIVGADLDLSTWGLLVAEYSGETLGAAVAASYNSGDVFFGFRDGSIDDIGMLEFMARSDVMNYAGAEGFLVDNINITPEPASMTVILLGAVAMFRRRKR